MNAGMNEIGRPPTLLGLPSYLAGHVARIGNRPLVDALAEHGLRLPHFAVLAALHDLGPTAQHELADRLGFNRSHLVGYLDHLGQAGRVARERDADDRRRQLVSLTPAGARLAEELIDTARAVERAQFDALTPAELTLLTELLRRVLDIDDAAAGGDRGTAAGRGGGAGGGRPGRTGNGTGGGRPGRTGARP